MAHLHLTSIHRIPAGDTAHFKAAYLRPQLPVIFTDLSKRWPAYEKWNQAYFSELGQNISVDLYDNSRGNPAKSTMEPDARMTFSQYLQLLEQGPVQLRMFLFNIMKHVPHLCHDYEMPELPGRFIRDIPMMFFEVAGQWYTCTTT